MGKKRDKANENIATLVREMVGYMQGYVRDYNCPYKFNLVGAEHIKKPSVCNDCESCKKEFWLDLESHLLDENIVE